MGKPLVDAPDPLEQPGVAQSDADDLLSQLAGEEIDRLLAEADVERPPAQPAPLSSSNVTALKRDADAQGGGASPAVGEALERALHAVPVGFDAAEDARLKVLASELELDVPSLPAALSTASTHPAPAESAAEVLDPDEDEDDAPLPIWCRPLEWINAPLDACPEVVRQIMGKAAIVTLINALAVIGYVVIVRRRH